MNTTDMLNTIRELGTPHLAVLLNDYGRNHYRLPDKPYKYHGVMGDRATHKLLVETNGLHRGYPTTKAGIYSLSSRFPISPEFQSERTYAMYKDCLWIRPDMVEAIIPTSNRHSTGILHGADTF